MLNRLSERFSRRRLQRHSSPADSKEEKYCWPSYISQASGSVKPVQTGSAPRSIEYSQAGYQAHDPLQDAHVLAMDSSGPQKHLFAAVITSSTTAQGGNYLRRNLHRQLMKQVAAHGDVPKAFRAAVFALDRSWRDMHPFNRNVLEGVNLAAAYVDLASSTLHVASTGACRVVVGGVTANGELDIIADVGRPENLSQNGGLSGGILSMQLTERVDTVIVGSAGLWRELSTHSAILRMQQFFATVPQSAAGSAAAHLDNHALHAVTRRTCRMRDPRMRALREVCHLQSLWAGDVTNYKWGGRQPVRRRRGDVHQDLTAVVLRMDWPGKPAVTPMPLTTRRLRNSSSLQNLPKCASTNTLSTTMTKARAGWQLLRLHLLTFPLEQKLYVRNQWYEAVRLALEQKQQQQQQQGATAVSKLQMSATQQIAVRANSSTLESYPIEVS